MLELIAIRHGQSLYNIGETVHLDSSLTQLGMRQVAETAKHLAKHYDLDGFIGRTSPYLRCLETSRIIAEETGLKFVVEEAAREVMVTYAECDVPGRQALFPEFTWPTCRGWSFFRETEKEFNTRIEAYFNSLKNIPKVLVVSHGTPTTTLAYLAAGKYEGVIPIKKGEFVANSSVSYVRDGELVCFSKVCYGEDLCKVAECSDN
jgi:broad specificity phosphatase PhoE